MIFKSIEFDGGTIKTTYTSGVADSDVISISSMDRPRPELYKTGSELVAPILEKLLYKGSAKGFTDAKMNVALNKVVVRNAKKAAWSKEICFRFDISHGNQLQTGWIGIRDFVSEKPEFVGCANAELSATINAFLDEVMKYICGERAQGKLFGGGENTDEAVSTDAAKTNRIVDETNKRFNAMAGIQTSEILDKAEKGLKSIKGVTEVKRLRK